jgi:hypothetical protein
MLRQVLLDLLIRFENVDQSTLNTYTQAISEQKRTANTIVVGILFSENASPDQLSANGSQKALDTRRLERVQSYSSDCFCGA